MKARSLFLAALIVFLTTASWAQTLVERLYIMRAETTTVEQISGMIHTCVLIYPNGGFRIEKQEQSMYGGKPETKVYQGTLPDADLKSWEAVLADPGFVGIKVEPPKGGIVENMDTLYISVPREHGMQNIGFNNAADRRPYDKALKPFQTALKSIEKRKVPVAKTEQPNNCDPPKVMYRTTFRTDKLPDDQSQH